LGPGLAWMGTAALAVIQVPGMAENANATSRVVQDDIQGVMAGISFIGAGWFERLSERRKSNPEGGSPHE
jgi:putative Mg2+ transporter-C (MgtC) family protein